jgi:acetoin utilization protein AcuC
LDTRKAIFVHSGELEKYSYPADCPFNTDRARQLRKVLNSMGLLSGDGRREMAPVAAERVVLKKFHTSRYLHALKTAAMGRWDVEALNMGIGTLDCPVFAGMYDYAVLASGATLTGAKAILSGSADVAFNPSGGFHHARPELAAGFCYINDVALACTVLAEKAKKVLYLDVDVHHGDGVAYAFYERSDVMTISLHENPKTLFPGTGFEDEIGEGKGRGYCVNVPLPVGTYDKAYMNAFDAVAMPLIEAYKPDVFVYELGADALAGDPLAHLYLTNRVYAEVTGRLLTFNRPILMTGGGGYNVRNTVRAWALAWTVLCGADNQQDLAIGLGGVMLQSTDWQGGLWDRTLPIPHRQRQTVESALKATVELIKAKVFPIHGL